MRIAFAEAASPDGSYRTGDGIVTPLPVFLRRHLRKSGSSGRKHRSNLSDGGVAKAWGREAALDGVIARKGRKVLTWQSVLFHETNSRILLLRPSCQGCGLPRHKSFSTAEIQSSQRHMTVGAKPCSSTPSYAYIQNNEGTAALLRFRSKCDSPLLLLFLTY